MFQRIQNVYDVAQNMLPGKDQHTNYKDNPNPKVRFLWKITKGFDLKSSAESVFLKRLKGKMDLERAVNGKKRMTCVEAATHRRDGAKATTQEKAQAEKFCAGVKTYLAELTKKQKSKDDSWPIWLHVLLGFLTGFILFGPHAIDGWRNIFRGGGRGGPFGGVGGGASVDDIAKAATIGALTTAGILGADEAAEVGETASETASAAEGTSEAAAMTAATKRVASVLSQPTVASRFTVPAHSAKASALANRAAALNVKSVPLTWTQLGWGAVGLMALGAAALATSKLPDKGSTVRKLAPTLAR